MSPRQTTNGSGVEADKRIMSLLLSSNRQRSHSSSMAKTKMPLSSNWWFSMTRNEHRSAAFKSVRSRQNYLLHTSTQWLWCGLATMQSERMMYRDNGYRSAVAVGAPNFADDSETITNQVDSSGLSYPMSKDALKSRDEYVGDCSRNHDANPTEVAKLF